MNAVINLEVQSNAGNFVNRLGPVRFSGRSLLHGTAYLFSYKLFS